MPITVAIALFFGFQSIAQVPVPIPAPPKPSVESDRMQIEGPYVEREDRGQTTKVVLKNGLTVIVREQQAVPLTNITTFVKAGYFDEDDRTAGISHVIEHMFFKGTATRPVGQIARETKALGGNLNAYTYYDRTVYHTVVPAENAVKALDIQADALQHSSFDAAELKREIEVVLQENNRKLDNPSAVASEKLFAVAFQQHRMKRWRIGTPEGLRALTRDDIVAYYARYYRPSNIILSIVGQFDREEMLAEVVKRYADMPDQAVERDKSPAEPPQTEPRYGSQHGPIEQTHVAIGFHAPGILSPEARAMEVLAAILGDGRASRLIQYVRDEKNLISAGSAQFHAFKDLGYFEVDLETAKPVEAQIAVLAEIENIKRFGITNETLGRAKGMIAQNTYHHLETVDGIAEDLAFYEYLGSWRLADNYISTIQHVTAEDVVNAAKKYLTTPNLSVFEYLPTSVTRSYTDSQFQNAVLANVAAAVLERRERELPVTTDIAPPPDPVAIDLIRPIVKRSILRGPDVYVLEDHRLPLVSFGIFFPGGRLYESPKNAGITELMLRSALRGTRRFSSADIARRMENAGATIQVVNEADFFGYIVDGLSPKIGDALDILIDILQAPEFKVDEVAKEKTLQLARIGKLKENNYAYPVSLFMQTLYGDYAYARPAVGAETGVQSIGSDDLTAWFKQNERPLVPSIFIVGDTHGTGLVSEMTDALTNVDLHERKISTLPVPDLKREASSAPAASDAREAVEEVQRQQTALVYGFPGASRADVDRFPLEILANIVSGLGGRFFDAIRDKQGLAYTVHTRNVSFAKSGAIFTYTAFSPDNEAKVRESLQAEIDRLRKDGVSKEEVDRAVAYSIGEHEIGMQTRDAQVLEYARSTYAGTGAQDVENYNTQIRKVTPELVRAIANAYLDPKYLRVAIVRGVKK